jgi:hypothetical protein
MTVILFLTLCVLLFLLTFYRLAKLNKTAQLRVRLAYFALAAASVGSVSSVIVFGHDPSWIECAMLAAFCFVQAATMRAWESGYPHSFTTNNGAFDDASHHHHDHHTGVHA